MCGIAGILGPSASSELAGLMAQAQRHRGPDDEGIQVLPTGLPGVALALGQRRLSILDLSPAGHQPMHDPASGLWTVYNGEIYNHLDLRQELGGEYRSTCDTETLLRAVGRWGRQAVQRFRGMFAFAVWDPSRRELWLCRDRLGIKPLYYAQVGPNFLFASELRALLTTGLVERRLDPDGLNGYLAFGAVQEPATIIRGVRLLPAGHWLRVSPGDRVGEPERYWAPPFRNQEAGTNGAEPAERVGKLVEEAVGCRLLSDVPLGAFLSGGIDSGVIVAAMARREHKAIRTFTLHFTEKGYGEGPYAERLAALYRTEHTTEQVSANDLLAHFDEALEAADQPSTDVVNSYYVCKLARRSGLKVALCGHGGDELFGGYDNFRLIPRILRFRAIPRPLRRLVGCAIRGLAPVRVATRKAASLLRSRAGIYEAYALARSMFWDETRAELLEDPRQLTPGADVVRAAVGPTDLAPDAVNQVSQLELCSYMRNTLLRDADVCSMAHGLEVRVPLIDHRLVEYVARLPGRLKVGGVAPKRLLVRAMKGALPVEIHTRRKQGFVIPYELWIRGALKQRFDEILTPESPARSAGLRPVQVGRVWRQFLDGYRGVNMQHPLALYVLLRWCAQHGVTA
ncbi:MAG TPA: asparagine synthase (glutamine-hydrolyzing) [Gemmataceae bacterium]|nr:asparagine synthase (glutamine-hydrolyzing) [Gemmataceae bacterium]